MVRTEKSRRENEERRRRKKKKKKKKKEEERKEKGRRGRMRCEVETNIEKNTFTRISPK